MKTLQEAIAEKFVITKPTPYKMNVWAKTKSGKKSRSVCGWDIRDALRNIPECKQLFSDKHINIGVYRDHLEIY